VIDGEPLDERQAKERVEEGNDAIGIIHGGTPGRFPPSSFKCRAASDPPRRKNYFTGFPRRARAPAANDSWLPTTYAVENPGETRTITLLATS